MIDVTEDAIRKIEHMFQAEGHKGQNLRVYVEGGGCSGLQYGLIFEDHHQADRSNDPSESPRTEGARPLDPQKAQALPSVPRFICRHCPYQGSRYP